MKAITYTHPGEPSVLEITEVAPPTLKDGEVIIKVLAAGINRPDIMQRKGLYPPPPGANPRLGLEVAGEIVQLNANSKFKRGDRVCALTNGGGYAQLCSVPEEQCLPWPQGFDAVQAAALPETFFTVWTNLFEIGKLSSQDSVLIHGGSGGIGTVAIQLAHQFGAKVYTTVGSEEKAKCCLTLGATHAIDYKHDDFVEKIKALTDGKGVNLILDIMGASYFNKNIKALDYDGRLVIISFQGGVKAQDVNLATMVGKRLTITGSTLRPRSSDFKGYIAQSLYKNVWPLLSNKKVMPLIHKVLPFECVQHAHELMESGSHSGKIILDLSHF
ncbi:Quinone oxidoreductase 1 [Commensalibacter sp. Nvir]|uniref:NAD(P)H-quinone oxidoreductase n=1 Tax=Commensalibacter sp. Nvir TaxID=3069817 RepID=UPI002D306B3A|nr:Quinone oxidoreductase 1 [Commensalibacter sp. Nvir]